LFNKEGEKREGRLGRGGGKEKRRGEV